MPDNDNRRELERLDARMAWIEDALVTLVRMEERMVTLFKRMDGYDAHQGKTMDRVAKLEQPTYGRGHFFRWIDRGGVAVIGAAVAMIFQKIW